jgi:FkbM family methyltransferase
MPPRASAKLTPQASNRQQKENMSVKRVFDTIRKRVPGFEFATILDVGANTGQSTEAFLAHAPSADILALEPSPESFAKLAEAYADNPRVQCLNIAASRAAGKASFIAKGTRTDNRIVAGGGENTILVDARPGDHVMAERGLDTVDYLKIDTEGHDLDVLAGFTRALLGGRIHFVEVEVGMHAQNRRHVPFHRVHAFMEAIGYPLFSLQEFAWETQSPFLLRRVNAIFAREGIGAR